MKKNTANRTDHLNMGMIVAVLVMLLTQSVLGGVALQAGSPGGGVAWIEQPIVRLVYAIPFNYSPGGVSSDYTDFRVHVSKAKVVGLQPAFPNVIVHYRRQDIVNAPWQLLTLTMEGDYGDHWLCEGRLLNVDMLEFYVEYRAPNGRSYYDCDAYNNVNHYKVRCNYQSEHPDDFGKVGGNVGLFESSLYVPPIYKFYNPGVIGIRGRVAAQCRQMINGQRRPGKANVTDVQIHVMDDKGTLDRLIPCRLYSQRSTGWFDSDLSIWSFDVPNFFLVPPNGTANFFIEIIAVDQNGQVYVDDNFRQFYPLNLSLPLVR